MGWTTPVTHVVGDILTASDWNTGMNDISFLASTGSALVDAPSGELVTSTSYAATVTAGPIVTITTGANAWVTVGMQMLPNAANISVWMSFKVSAGTTIASNDKWAVRLSSTGSSAWQGGSFGSVITGLNAGSNTFTAQYRVDSSSALVARRWLIVQPLP